MAGLVLAPSRTSLFGSIVSSSNPRLIAEPSSGGLGTQVHLKGYGFRANSQVTIHLGLPNADATPNSYAEGTTDSAGNFAPTFNMPGTWPNGQAITERKIIVVASASPSETKGLVEFDYGSQQERER